MGHIGHVLQDKVAIVTGAGNGIGRAIALRFASAGAKVVVAEFDSASGKKAVSDISGAGGHACFVEVDVTRAEHATRMVDEALRAFGGVDVLVNNAGGSHTENLLEVTEEGWDFDVRLNLTSVYLCCKAALPAMIAQGGGAIVNISSVNGLMAVGEIGYSAAKAGVINLTKNIAVTHGPSGIRCNVICPGTIETETVAAYWDRKAGGRQRLHKWYPLRRLGRPEEVASAALFLASEEAAFITGTTLVVDGGLTAGWTYFGRDIVTD